MQKKKKKTKIVLCFARLEFGEVMLQEQIIKQTDIHNTNE